jgi:hypothetical protein
MLGMYLNNFKGKGCYARMRATMEYHVKVVEKSMFSQGKDKVVTELQDMCVEISRRLSSDVIEIMAPLLDDYGTILCGLDPGKIITKEERVASMQIAETVREAEDMYRNFRAILGVSQTLSAAPATDDFQEDLESMRTALITVDPKDIPSTLLSDEVSVLGRRKAGKAKRVVEEPVFEKQEMVEGDESGSDNESAASVGFDGFDSDSDGDSTGDFDDSD